MLAVIMYRIILVSTQSFQTQRYRPIAGLIATSSGAFLNLILIMIVGRVYEKLAYRLTEWGKEINLVKRIYVLRLF